MKAKPAMNPAAAFPLAAHPPDEADLAAALGDTSGPLEAFFADVRSLQPGVTMEWKYSDRSGWYRIHLLKRRRLFYFIPKRDDFQLSLILGGKAVALLKAGPFGRRTATLQKTAKRYPEGTMFSFDRRTFAPDLLVAFVAAKLAH
ncbi:MAG: DUF3788 family protein [Verrucomicrobia bacterium]|nr:DUF3788 family protein [Verrucomicrobiota bacterium]